MRPSRPIRPTSTSRRPGAALLEVLVALTVLGTAAASIVVATSEAARAIERAREADASLRAANDFMDIVALWTRDDLDRRLGDRPQGPWRLRVGRPRPGLYTISLADSSDKRALLTTSLYRPLPPDVSR